MSKFIQMICVLATGMFLWFGVLEILENSEHFTGQDYLVLAAATMYVAGAISAFMKPFQPKEPKEPNAVITNTKTPDPAQG